MSEENLIPLKKRQDCTPEELARQEQIWASTKGSSSAKRSQGAYMRHLKESVKSGDTERIAVNIERFLTSPEASAKVILELLNVISTQELSQKNQLLWADKLIKISRNLYGDKITHNGMDLFNRELEAWVEAEKKVKGEEKKEKEYGKDN